MFRLEEPSILYLLILVPILITLVWWTMRWKSDVLKDLGDSRVFRRLYDSWSVRREWIKSGLLLTALLLLLVSWSNPQWGSRKEKVKAKRTDVIIALDISQSMMAEDILPNRMEKAKRFCLELIKKLRGERVGLVFFAGSAYLQMPLSTDFASANLYINSASPSQAGTQGTVIADAIELSQRVFGEENPTQKALIIISDGENHEQEAIDASKAALENGTTIFTIGIGTEEGANIPFVDRGRTTYKKTASGDAVRSALNVGLLQDVAQSGGGQFYMIDETFSALSRIDNEIARLEKREVEQRSFTDYNSYFQIFLLPALILLVLDVILSTNSSGKGQWRKMLDLDN